VPPSIAPVPSTTDSCLPSGTNTNFEVGLVSAHHEIVGKKVVVTASSTDALSPDVHAIVQVGAECAP